MESQRRSLPTVALTRGVAALLVACGHSFAQPQVCPTTPIALTGSSYASQGYGPNLGAAYFTAFANPVSSTNYMPSVSHTGLFSGTGGVTFLADTSDVAAPSGNPTGQGGIWAWNGTNPWTNSAANANLVESFGGTNSTPPSPPGGVSYTGAGFSCPMINSAGQSTFDDGSPTLVPAGSAYSEAPSMGLLMNSGMTAPGTGGATFSTWSIPNYLNAFGNSMKESQVAGAGVVTTAGPTQNNAGYWAGTPGSLTLLARQSDQLSTSNQSQIPGVLIGAPATSGISYCDSGGLLWAGALQGSNVNTTTSGGLPTAANNAQGLISTRQGFEELIAQRGNSFPDSSGSFYTGASTDGVQYNTVASAPDMNNAGSVVFSSSLRTSGGATPTTNGTAALFSDNSGILRTVARGTFALPSMPNLPMGLNWGNTFGATAINGAGTIAFTNSSMTGTDPNTNTAVSSAANSGLFEMNKLGVITKILRSGDTAPAWSAAAIANPNGNSNQAYANPALGQNAGSVYFSGVPSSFAMNAQGELFFVDALTGPGIVGGPNGNNVGLFGVDSLGNICLIAQAGMDFTVAPGDVRVVSTAGLESILTTGNQDGRQSAIDDQGRIAFWLGFTDGQQPSGVHNTIVSSSGIFYTQVPVPGTVVLVSLGAVLAGRRRCR